MDLSVVIVSWNVRECLRNCLVSVYETLADIPCEVIVVDNGSHDGTTAMLREQFPAVLRIENPDNRGYAAAANQGLARAAGSNLLLLNPDTELLPGTVRAGLDCLAAHPEFGLVSCAKLDEEGAPDPLDAFVSKFDPFSFNAGKYLRSALLFRLISLFPDSKRLQKWLFAADVRDYDFGLWGRGGALEVDYVLGSFMMCRRDFLERVGALDARFFFGMDDFDWCWRARRAGYKIVMLPEWKIVHLKERSISQFQRRARTEALTHARFTFYCKYRGRARLAAKTLGLVATRIASAAASGLLRVVLWWKKTDPRIVDQNPYRGSVSSDLRNLLRVARDLPPLLPEPQRRAAQI